MLLQKQHLKRRSMCGFPPAASQLLQHGSSEGESFQDPSKTSAGTFQRTPSGLIPAHELLALVAALKLLITLEFYRRTPQARGPGSGPEQLQQTSLTWFCLSAGPLLGSLNWTSTAGPSGSGSGRRRRSVEAELFSIEVTEVICQRRFSCSGETSLRLLCLLSLQVLLAVDYSVLLFHGQEHIQKYLLTLMNIVGENQSSENCSSHEDR